MGVLVVNPNGTSGEVVGPDPDEEPPNPGRTTNTSTAITKRTPTTPAMIRAFFDNGEAALTPTGSGFFRFWDSGPTIETGSTRVFLSTLFRGAATGASGGVTEGKTFGGGTGSVVETPHASQNFTFGSRSAPQERQTGTGYCSIFVPQDSQNLTCGDTGALQTGQRPGLGGTGESRVIRLFHYYVVTRYISIHDGRSGAERLVMLRYTIFHGTRAGKYDRILGLKREKHPRFLA